MLDILIYTLEYRSRRVEVWRQHDGIYYLSLLHRPPKGMLGWVQGDSRTFVTLAGAQSMAVEWIAPEASW